mmetsp:Transcript_5125/g.16940  ORF Transcript_5125/g.16940 Transcript_5125/m.16940 type:complete len:379 (-) Transcript_5125:624-1760(-)
MDSRMAAARCSNSRRTDSSCCSMPSTNGRSLTETQPYSRSILLSATTKGVCLERSMFIDSMVCGSSPCMMSMTRMATSHSDEPRDRRLEKDSWPGVSMMSSPGTRTLTFCLACSEPIRSTSVSCGKKEAPICWVMPPASPSCTLVLRMLSSNLVLPVSTWPMMQQMGDRSRLGVRAAIAAWMRASRSARAAALPASTWSSSSDSDSDSVSSSEPPSALGLKWYSLSNLACAARSASSRALFESSASAASLDVSPAPTGMHSSSSESVSGARPDDAILASRSSASHSSSASGPPPFALPSSPPSSPPPSGSSTGAASRSAAATASGSSGSPACSAPPCASASSPAFFFFRLLYTTRFLAAPSPPSPPAAAPTPLPIASR